MRPRHIFIYLLIVAALGIYYYYFEVYSLKMIEEQQDRASRVLSMEKDSIEEICIEGRDKVTLSKAVKTWMITSPINTKADQAELEDFMSTVTNLRSQRSLGIIDNMEGFGLEPPMLKISISALGKIYTLQAGADTPTKRFCYARASTREDVFLINAYERNSIYKDLFAFRDKDVFTLDQEDVDRIVLDRKGLIVEIIRENNNDWKPAKKTANIKLKASKINELLRSLCQLKAKAFVPKITKAKRPDILISLSSINETQSLKLWSDRVENGCMLGFSQAREQMVELPDRVLDDLPDDISDLMDRSIVHLDFDKINKIIVNASHETVLVKEDGLWYTGNRESVRELWDVNTLLVTLGRVEYSDEFMEPPKDEDISGRIRIYCKDLLPGVDVKLYTNRYVTVGEKVFQVSLQDLERLTDAMGVLCNRDSKEG